MSISFIHSKNAAEKSSSQQKLIQSEIWNTIQCNISISLQSNTIKEYQTTLSPHGDSNANRETLWQTYTIYLRIMYIAYTLT